MNPASASRPPAEKEWLQTCCRALGESEALAVGAVRDGLLVHTSAALARLFSMERGAHVRVSDLVSQGDRARVERALASPGEFSLAFRGLRSDGRLFEAQLTGCRVTLADGEAVAVAVQESGRDRDARHISYAELFDGSTGLPNRRLLADRLEQAIAAAGRGSHSVALMVIDLGVSGEEIPEPKEIGAQLRAGLRDTDTAAILGVRQYAVLLPRIASRAFAQTPAERVLAGLTASAGSGAMRRPNSCRIGVACYPEDAGSADALIEQAIAAVPSSGISYAAATGQRSARTPERIEWSARYEVGIEVIDGQHRHLLELVNRLGDELRGARDPDSLTDGLRELLRYTEHHFATEERLMDEVGASADRHRSEHHRLIDSLSNKTLRVGPEDVSESSRFLQDWLFSHIDEVDRPFAAMLRNRGLK